MRRVFQGRAGMALAFILGLVIATAGTATAAKLITGKQIKDGSISNKDLSKAVRAQLAKAGVAGPQGTKGDQGAKGDKGDKGDSGPAAVSINRTIPVPSSGITTDLLAQVGDLSVYGECIAGFGSRLLVASSATDAQETSFAIDTSGAITAGSGPLTSTKTPIAVAGLIQPSKNGQLIYRSAARTITLAFYIQGDAGGCVFGGTLVSAPAT